MHEGVWALSPLSTWVYLHKYMTCHYLFSPMQVILSPNAVTADGGAICPSGMLMVCVAAKVRDCF